MNLGELQARVDKLVAEHGPEIRVAASSRGYLVEPHLSLGHTWNTAPAIIWIERDPLSKKGEPVIIL